MTQSVRIQGHPVELGNRAEDSVTDNRRIQPGSSELLPPAYDPVGSLSLERSLPNGPDVPAPKHQ